MRASEIFTLGTITGAVAVWLCSREIDHVAKQTRAERAQAAAGQDSKEPVREQP
jgi:hypothetical protein